MNGHEKSDSSVVPVKSSNKDRATAREAEAMEERGLAKGNPSGTDTRRTQGRGSVTNGLDRVRDAARRDSKQRFTALLHHVYDVGRLRAAYQGTRKDAAAGVDRVTWKAYGERLEENLRDLSGRLRRGAYRASPVRRAYITKADGGQRPLGVPTLEDKIVQRAVAEVMNAVYEQDFLGFSYGFRPGRNQHQALDALAVGLHEKNVKWVLDADIRGFFDTLDHRWLVKFVEHRIGDQRIIRLLRKWLKAGVLEEGELVQSEAGTVQGGSISPLLANIYLHYVLDSWAHRWRKTQAYGEVIIVRFADDFVVGFEHRDEGKRFLAELRERLAAFALELHPDKTRLLEFGRFASTNRRRRGEGKSGTFEFLGFTHIYGHSRRGRAMLLRKTSRKRFQAKLQALHRHLWRNLNWSVPKMGKYLGAVLRGHVAYYGVPTNSKAIAAFRFAMGRIWKQVLERRSERTRIRWERIRRLIDRWLPLARICHPYPSVRFVARTQGRSPVR
ncbi:MAG: group II intron reverse transcriptase/maturase [Calditrichaeota bacterium]|nr:group II intron reverse transcriptase/maturase [Calditrichota bacterium]